MLSSVFKPGSVTYWKTHARLLVIALTGCLDDFILFFWKNRSLNFFFFFHVVTDFLKSFEFERIYELWLFSTFKFRFLLQIEAFAKLNTQWRKITTAYNYARSRRTPQSVHDIIWAVLQFRLTTVPASVEIKPWNKQLTKRENNLKLTGDEGHL